MLKYSIVLYNNQWNELRPLIKTLQKQGKIKYSAHGYTSDKVLILCESDKETSDIVDKKLEEILGYVYA